MQQNSVFKAREEKYQSRIKVLETLASGTSEENEVSFKKNLSPENSFFLFLETYILLF